MIKKLLPFLLLASTLYAEYYPSDFVEQFHKASQKKEFLFSYAKKNHRSLGYFQARKVMFGIIDLKEENQHQYVEDVYCQNRYGKEAGVAPFRVPNNSVLNCEHSWPQSKFTTRFPENLQKSDLHHLYPSNTKANQIRGNHPFGDVIIDSRGVDICEPSHIGKSERVNSNDSLSFEPPDRIKGNIARSLFYFSVRYQAEIDPVQEHYLRLWNEIDPIDGEEVERNNQIANYQGNRNPFIDFPEMISEIENF